MDFYVTQLERQNTPARPPTFSLRSPSVAAAAAAPKLRPCESNDHRKATTGVRAAGAARRRNGDGGQRHGGGGAAPALSWWNTSTAVAAADDGEEALRRSPPRRPHSASRRDEYPRLRDERDRRIIRELGGTVPSLGGGDGDGALWIDGSGIRRVKSEWRAAGSGRTAATDADTDAARDEGSASGQFSSIQRVLSRRVTLLRGQSDAHGSSAAGDSPPNASAASPAASAYRLGIRPDGASVEDAVASVDELRRRLAASRREAAAIRAASAGNDVIVEGLRKQLMRLQGPSKCTAR
jgi:hypothetical protein